MAKASEGCYTETNPERLCFFGLNDYFLPVETDFGPKTKLLHQVKTVSSLLKRGTTSRAERLAKEADQAKLEKASIQYVEGLSQEIHRIVRGARHQACF